MTWSFLNTQYTFISVPRPGPSYTHTLILLTAVFPVRVHMLQVHVIVHSNYTIVSVREKIA